MVRIVSHRLYVSNAPSAVDRGIKCYNKCLGSFLHCFKIATKYKCEGKIYYVNRKSLKKYSAPRYPSLQLSLPQQVLNPPNMRRGTISINKKETAWVGADKSYGFGKTLQLLNGNFLQVSPKDLIYNVQVITNLSDGTTKTRYKELPSSLFTQARIGDTIHYKKETKNYEFKLVPHFRVIGGGRSDTSEAINYNEPINFDEYLDPIEATSFDECVKCVEATAEQDRSMDFYAKKDIPKGYNVKKTGPGIFRSSPPTPENGFPISRGDPYTLSPKTKRIHLNQNGVAPLNFEDLLFVHTSAANSKSHKSQDDKGCTILIEAPGRPDLEILLDGNHLYVTQKEKGDFVNDTPKFYHTTFETTPTKAIDETNISAKLDDTGMLRIYIPFLNI